MADILITRDLKSDDWLKVQFENSNNTITGISFLEIKQVSFKEFPKTEWIFFYSRNGVRYFINQLADINFFKKFKIAALGNGTSEELLKHGVHADYTGKTQPNQVAIDFLSQYKPKSVVFPKALSSRNSIRELIENQCICYDLVVYSNEIKAVRLDFHPSIIVFTSPMNVDGYLKENKLTTQQKVISMGPSTTSKLKDYAIENIQELEIPDEEAIYKMILKNLE